VHNPCSSIPPARKLASLIPVVLKLQIGFAELCVHQRVCYTTGKTKNLVTQISYGLHHSPVTNCCSGIHRHDLAMLRLAPSLIVSAQHSSSLNINASIFAKDRAMSTEPHSEGDPHPRYPHTSHSSGHQKPIQPKGLELVTCGGTSGSPAAGPELDYSDRLGY
jgi:hypothetical protein